MIQIRQSKRVHVCVNVVEHSNTHRFGITFQSHKAQVGDDLLCSIPVIHIASLAHALKKSALPQNARTTFSIGKSGARNDSNSLMDLFAVHNDVSAYIILTIEMEILRYLQRCGVEQIIPYFIKARGKFFSSLGIDLSHKWGIEQLIGAISCAFPRRRRY